LQLVVCQLRHELLDPGALKDRVRAIRRALGDAYATMAPGGPVQVRLAASPEKLDVGEQHEGWQLKSGDGAWTVVVTNEFFALETTRYLDWDDFMSRFTALAKAVTDASDIVAELRLGLRYIDRLTDPPASTPADWAAWLEPSFAGPLGAPGLGAGVLALQGIAQFDGGDGHRINLRYGCVESDPPGSWDFLLDHDCFREAGVEFSIDSTLKSMERLHVLGLQVFQAAITPAYFEYLRGDAS
jgi:uncharacterized protein (TIGR04255 family)